MTLDVVGGAVFAAGLVVAFAGNQPRPRILGLGAMGGGALLVLLSGGPTTAAAWWMVVTAGATFAALVGFAVYLAREADRRGDGPAGLDDELG